MTVARLCLWADPDRVDELEEAYERQLAPLLRERGLVGSAEGGRPTVSGVVSRLFAFDSPSAFHDMRHALQRDPIWEGILLQLGSRFDPGRPQRLTSDGYQFTLYESPAEPDQTVEAGPGTRRGDWLTFGVQDGLPSVSIASVGRTRDGCLWLLSERGLTRYDGETLCTFAVGGPTRARRRSRGCWRMATDGSGAARRAACSAWTSRSSPC